MGEVSSTSNTELLLAVFGASDQNEIQGRTRIQKLICYLQYGLKFPFDFDFRPYFYGPYSEDLSDSFSNLVSLNVLSETITALDFDRFLYSYRLTDEGKKLVEKVTSRLSKVDRKLVPKLESSVRELEAVPTPKLIEMAKQSSQMP